MIEKNISVFLFLILSLFSISCGGGIKRIESIEGMLCVPPVRSVPDKDSNKFRISAEIYSSTPTPRTGIIQRGWGDSGNTYLWNLTKFGFVCNIDAYSSTDSENRHALSAGLGGTFINNQFFGMGRLGYAREVNYKIIGIRFDLGISIMNFHTVRFPYADMYDPTGQYAMAHKQSSTELRLGYFASFTSGVHFPESAWRFQIQCSLSLHTFSGSTRIIIRTGDDPPTGIKYVTATPFISYDLANRSRLVSGVRMVHEIEEITTTGTFIYLPFIQFEFNLL